MLLCLAAFFGSLVTNQHVFVGFPCLALAIVLWPFLFPGRHTRFDLFSPWLGVVVSVVLSVTLRGLYIELKLPSQEEVDHYFLRGLPTEAFFRPGLILLASLALLTAGFRFGGRKRSRPPSLPGRLAHDRWSDRRLVVVVVLFTLATAVALVLYALSSGGFDPTQLSATRRHELETGSRISGFGALLAVGSLGRVAFLLVLVRLTASKRRLSIPRAALLGVLFLVAVSLPFYGSTRLPIMWLIICTCGVFYYTGYRVGWKALVAVALAAALALNVMVQLRKSNTVKVALDASVVAKIFEPAVVNQNLLGIAKTGQIINAVPNRLPLAYGRSIAVWFVAPIPRQVWPDKPNISSGKEIADKVYGQPTGGGIPPGLVGELYWNFALPGALLGALLAGLLLRRLYDRFSLRSGADDRNRLFFYAVVILPIGGWVLDVGLGGMFFFLIRESVLAGVSLLLVNESPAHRRSRRRGVLRGRGTNRRGEPRRPGPSAPPRAAR
jgi:oligosaccharide repeat unit polymerase